MMRKWLVATLLSASGGVAVADDIEGRLDWSQRVELGTPLSGRIAQVTVTAGDRVKAGALLVALDQQPAVAGVKAAKARLEAARKDKLEAEKELERTLDLFDRTVLSEHDRNLAEIAAATASAKWLEAMAGVADAQGRLEEGRITAPFGGRVVRVNAIIGATTVNHWQSESLVVLADDSRLLARGLATLAQTRKLALGERVEVAVQGEWHGARVEHLGLEPTGSGEAPAYPLTVALEGVDAKSLRVGEPVVIRFE